MRAKHRATLSLTLGSALALFGCETRTTSVVIADTSRVTVVGANGVALPTAENAANEQRALIADGSFVTEPGARADYKIEAVRKNKELALEWSSKVPIINGEHQTLITPDGKFNDPNGVIGLLTPRTMQAPTFRFTACAELDSVSAKGGGVVGFRATEWNSCHQYAVYANPLLSAPVTVETPWSNVVEIRDHTEVSIPGSIAIGIFSLAATGGGVALIAVPKGCPGCVIGGVGLALLGALTTLTVVLDMSDPSRDGVTYPVHPGPQH